MRGRIIREIILGTVCFAGSIVCVDYHIKGWRMVVAMIFYMMYLSYKCAELVTVIQRGPDVSREPGTPLERLRQIYSKLSYLQKSQKMPEYAVLVSELSKRTPAEQQEYLKDSSHLKDLFP